MADSQDQQVTSKMPTREEQKKALILVQSIIKKELSNPSDNISPRYRFLLAATSIFLILTKYAIFRAEGHPSRDQDEVNSE